LVMALLVSTPPMIGVRQAEALTMK